MHFNPSPFPIYKVSATGNDFLLVDLRVSAAKEAWAKEFGAAPRTKWVKRFCDRHEGLGADGLVFLEAHATCDFVWDFYNSDGSAAEMCGNAARAVSLFAARRGGESGAPEKLRFQTVVGVVEAQIFAGGEVAVELPPISEVAWTEDFALIRPGVPHAVVDVVDIQASAELRQRALALKKLPQFAREGVNVTFVQTLSPTRIASITFERGVEEFTRACGTGAIAAAYSILRGKENVSLEVQVPGGNLSVVWSGGRPTLRGPAKIVAVLHWVRS